MPPIEPSDLETIARPIDFLGINYYSRQMVSADGETGRPVHVRPQGDQFTTMDWEVHPDALHELLVRVHRDYAPAQVYVTENGAAYDDVQVHDGSIRDVERQSYLEAHLRACAHAIRDGVPLAGYFYWSLLDNFEWGWGYQKRFGLVYVDYPTQERVPKGSFDWYRRFIQRHVRERAA
jgi:beta-glucosidase